MRDASIADLISTSRTIETDIVSIRAIKAVRSKFITLVTVILIRRYRLISQALRYRRWLSLEQTIHPIESD